MLTLATKVLAEVNPALYPRTVPDRVAPAGQEFRCELAALANVHRLQLVGQPVSSSMVEIFQPFGVGQ